MHVLAAYCALKQSSDILASPGTMLAPALSTHREQQKQHILMLVSAKATTAQRHAHHCSICGAARHTQACLHTRTHVHAHAHTRTHACARTHTYKHKRARVYTQARTHTYTCTRTNTQTHARAHIHTHKYTGTHARAHTHTHTHTRAHTHTHTRTHTCICTHTFARDWHRQFFSVASDAPTLVKQSIELAYTADFFSNRVINWTFDPILSSVRFWQNCAENLHLLRTRRGSCS